MNIKSEHNNVSSLAGEVRLRISQRLSRLTSRRVDFRSELLQNTRWLLNIAKMVSGYDPALRLKKVLWDDFKQALSSRKAFLAALQSRWACCIRHQQHQNVRVMM